MVTASRWLGVLLLLILSGVSIYGGLAMVIDADGTFLGVEAALPELPFESFTVPGFSMLILLGGGSISAATMLGSRYIIGWWMAVVVDLLLMIWLFLQLAHDGLTWPPVWASVSLFLALGLTLFLCAGKDLPSREKGWL